MRVIQGDVSDLQVRLGVLEERIHPASLVTPAQANQISLQVKALAELLTGREKGTGHYQKAERPTPYASLLKVACSCG